MSTESGKALKELALALKIMAQPSSVDPHIETAKSAVKKLNSLLKSSSWQNIDLLQATPVVTVASLLIDVVNCTEKIVESVYELASKAHFESVDPTVSPEVLQLEPTQKAKSAQKVDCPHVIITVNEPNLVSEQENSSAPKTSKQMEV